LLLLLLLLVLTVTDLHEAITNMPQMLHRVTVRVINASDFTVKMAPYRHPSLLSHTKTRSVWKHFQLLLESDQWGFV